MVVEGIVVIFVLSGICPLSYLFGCTSIPGGELNSTSGACTVSEVGGGITVIQNRHSNI